jgi:hypothetical protein
MILCFVGLSVSPKGDDWTLRKEKDGIRVYSRRVENLAFDELRVTCELDCRMSQLAAVLLDYDNHVNWVYGTKSVQVLRAISATEQYFHTEVAVPWPFENRDLCVHFKMTQDSSDRTLTAEGISEPDYLPMEKNLVRVPMSHVTWVATRLEDKIAVDYRIRIDPGGSIPAWLVNLFSSRGPYESFSKLKRRVREPAYQTAHIPGVID